MRCWTLFKTSPKIGGRQTAAPASRRPCCRVPNQSPDTLLPPSSIQNARGPEEGADMRNIFAQLCFFDFFANPSLNRIASF